MDPSRVQALDWLAQAVNDMSAVLPLSARQPFLQHGQQMLNLVHGDVVALTQLQLQQQAAAGAPEASQANAGSDDGSN